MFVLDTDPGIDDAFALLLTTIISKEECVAISSYGNAPLEITHRNLTGLMEAFSLDYSVYLGASRPLGEIDPYYDFYHGPDALGGVSALLPRSPRRVCGIHQLEKDLDDVEVITYCVVGPLTNLAKLILTNSSIVPKISEVLIMGGGISRFNCPNDSEFNFHADPVATSVVLGSGLPLVIAPFDLGMAFPLGSAEISEIQFRSGNVIVSELAKASLDAAKRHNRIAADVHDGFPVLFHVDSNLFCFRTMHLVADRHGAIKCSDDGRPVAVLTGLKDERVLTEAIIECSQRLSDPVCC